MTEAIREYIKGLSKEKLRECLHEGDAIYMPKKNKYPFHSVKESAVFLLVGDIEKIDPGEDLLTIKDKVTITAIEFWDWGILSDCYDDDEDEETEKAEEEMQEIITDVIYAELELEVGDYKHALYNSYQGVNLYRAPLKTPIVLIRTAPLLRPEGMPEEEDIEVTLVAKG
jgi:hypothetical protein